MAQSAMWQAQLNQLYNLYLRMVPPMSSEIGDDIFLDLPMVYSWFYHGKHHIISQPGPPVPRSRLRCGLRCPRFVWPGQSRSASVAPALGKRRPNSPASARHGIAGHKENCQENTQEMDGNGWKWMEMDGKGWKSGKIWSESAKQCR